MKRVHISIYADKHGRLGADLLLKSGNGCTIPCHSTNTPEILVAELRGFFCEIVRAKAINKRLKPLHARRE